MIGLLQRVNEASVVVEGETVGTIARGLLVLVGVERDDTEAQARRLLERLLGYRVFPDAGDRMNLSLRQHPVVASGRFGADMKVGLVNDGPVTFWLQVAPTTG